MQWNYVQNALFSRHPATLVVFLSPTPAGGGGCPPGGSAVIEWLNSYNPGSQQSTVILEP